MRNDIDCPYCGKGQDINNDDGYGYEEGTVYDQECENCEKMFTYTTSVHYYYNAKKAPCLNDGEHDWQPITGFPEEYFIGKQRCGYCAEERQI